MDSLIQSLHLDWLVVAALVATAGQAAWEDYKTGRIRNALVARLLLIGAIWFWVLAILVGVFDGDPKLIYPAHSLPDYLLRVLRNSAVALAIGIILWFGRLWAAGDSKLFPLVVLVLPLRFYSGTYVSLWPAFVLFYNFVLATMLIILADLVRRGAQVLGARRRAARTPNPDAEPPAPLMPRFLAGVRANAGDWGRFALMLILAFMFVKVLRHFMREVLDIFVHLDATILYVVLFFACHPIIHLLHKTWILIAAAAIDIVFLCIAIFTDWIPGLTVGTMLAMSVTAFALMAFRMLYDGYQAKMDYVEIEADDLQPKMILSEALMRRIQLDKPYFQAQQAELGALLPDGLKPEQVPLVQRWLRERLPGSAVQVQKTFPMGPPIFFGLLLTILLQDYALHLPR